MTEPATDATKGESAAHRLRLFHQLQMAAHDLRRHADRVVAGTGLSTAQLAVLAVVADQQPVPQRAVADQLGLRESAVTAMVGRLEQLGVLERVADPDDGRVRRLRLTGKGVEVSADAATAFAAVNRSLDHALGRDGVARLADLLGLVRRAAGEDR